VRLIDYFDASAQACPSKTAFVQPDGARLTYAEVEQQSRNIASALHGSGVLETGKYGQPNQRCITPPVPAAGFQAAVEERWQHDDAAISAIFRDTTLQAFEGCLYGPASGWCGLHGQILVRISSAAPQSVACAPPAWPGSAGGTVATTSRPPFQN
jgi:hypothetical protein